MTDRHEFADVFRDIIKLYDIYNCKLKIKQPSDTDPYYRFSCISKKMVNEGAILMNVITKDRNYAIQEALIQLLRSNITMVWHSYFGAYEGK